MVKGKSEKYGHRMHVAAVARHPRHLEFINWIGAGPSLRSRARLALLSAFLIAAPALFIGVVRVHEVSRTLRNVNQLNQFETKASQAKVAIVTCEAALWRLIAQPEFENERILKEAAKQLRAAIGEMLLIAPSFLDASTSNIIESTSLRIQIAVDQTLQHVDERTGKEHESFTVAGLALSTLSLEVDNVKRRASEILTDAASDSSGALDRVGRDELVLFLILLFGIPVMLGPVPLWIVAPLVRLRGIEHKIEEGRIRELAVAGKDEISSLARTIKSALVWREELDQRKSAKIFEIRNVLRAVINHVVEPVLITDRQGKINYANQPASALFGIESHYLEGSNVVDHMYSPVLSKALSKAVTGDIPQAGVEVNLEFQDGRSVLALAQLSAVRDREGQVSRLVIVLMDVPSNVDES